MSKIIAEGKTKRVLDDGDSVILEAIDRLTAGDASKIAEIGTIGTEKTRQCANIFRAFEREGIETAFLEEAAPNQLRCRKVEMLPLEMVMRRFAYGSFLKRNPSLVSGEKFDTPLKEIFHKAAVIMPPLVDAPVQMSENKARDLYLKETGWEEGVYTDPYVRVEAQDWAIFSAKSPIEGEPLMRVAPELQNAELTKIWNELLSPAFDFLEKKLQEADIALVDIKFEIGRRVDNGALVIADVVDNDSWRIWPKGDPKAQLDKQGFRDGDGIDDVLKNYKIVTQITETF